MTRAKDISKIITDADLSGTLDVTGTITVGDGHTIGDDGSDNLVITSSSGEAVILSSGASAYIRTLGGTNRFLVDGATGDISFYEDTGTTPKLFWDASAETLDVDGPVLVGGSLAADQTNRLALENVSNLSSIISYGATAGTGALRIITGGGGGSGGAEAMRIDSSGNVGIGTTSPNRILTVQSSVGTVAHFDSTNSSGSGGGISLADANTTSNYVRVRAVGNDIQFTSGNAERVRIDSSGNVGIGTSSPDKPLHVVGPEGVTTFSSYGARDVLVLENNDNANVQLITGNTSSATILFSDPDASGSGRIGYSHSSNDMFFYANGSEAMRIDSDGNVGIGLTVPSYHLDVRESAGAAVRFARGNLVASPARTLVRFEDSDANTVVGTIAVTTSSTAYNTSSDHRLKENVTADWDATTRLKQLNPVRFNFIADADTTVDGFLAHEVQSVVPEAITGTHNEVEVWQDGEELPDGVSVGDNKLDEDGNTIPVYQGIDQSKLVPLLVKTIQELEARITALENGE